MVDEHCRITVVGERRQVDLAVPAAAPISTYVDTLARMCAESGNDIMPPAWSLATATTGPFAPERSLSELGIADGQVLFLRDIIADEFADPVVHDVVERVTEVAEAAFERRWSDAARTVTVMAVGIGWLVAALIALAARHQESAGTLDDLAVTAGLVLPALAWVAAERRWPVPPGLRTVLALSAVPLLSLAAGNIAGATHLHGQHPVLTPHGLTVMGLTVGALIGALVAYTAAPNVATTAVSAAAIAVAVVGVLLGAVKANGLESAGVASVVAFLLLTFTPLTVSQIVAYVSRRPGAREPGAAADETEVAAAVRAATVLLLLWSGALAAVLGAAMVAMAASRSPYAAGAAACLGCGLLLRAGAGRLIAEVVPVGLAGAAGLLTLILVGPGHLGWRPWTAPFAAFVVAVAMLCYGFRRFMRRPDLPSMPRPGWFTSAGSFMGGGAVVLVIGVFGVYGHVVTLGHHL